MKSCEICNAPHDRQGKRTCGAVECIRTLLKRAKRNAARRERHEILTSLGLKRVKGNLGGTYYE